MACAATLIAKRTFVTSNGISAEKRREHGRKGGRGARKYIYTRDKRRYKTELTKGVEERKGTLGRSRERKGE